jgi:hypothetical protein
MIGIINPQLLMLCHIVTEVIQVYFSQRCKHSLALSLTMFPRPQDKVRRMSA